LKYKIYADERAVVEDDPSYSNFESIKIPSKIKVDNKYYPVSLIYCGAFKNLKKLNDVVIPSSVTHIYFDAFRGCQNLESIVIPSNVKEIGSGVFSY